MATSNTPQQPKQVSDAFTNLWAAIRNWFNDLLDLETGLDREGTIIAIRNNKRIQGANAWLLGCSIMIASLGLDLNSPAVIIGAMLVSPLMSPILGIGLGVAINDKDSMFTSIRHFGIAILIALFVSTLYFFVTPFGNITSEIRGRTSPTFLDGLVAIFGGFAGIISSTRKDKTNAIPGVAIATALMPPLCVTGFGVAEVFELWIKKGNMPPAIFQAEINRAFGIIGGSFYLFFLNSFFIALTTYSIIRLLRFPLKSYVNAREARRNRMITAFFSFLVTLPSGIILYNLYEIQQDEAQVSVFVEDHFERSCINYELTSVDQDTNKLILQLLGQRIHDTSIVAYQDMLNQNYALNKPVRLFPVQAEMSMEDIKTSLQAQRQEVVTMLEQERQEINTAIVETEALKRRLAKRHSDSTVVAKSLRLAREAFGDEIQAIQYAPEVQAVNDSATVNLPPVFMVDWANRSGTKVNKDRLERILRISADLDTLQLISY
jgi:uncharacterized hydrophobic protein (TIGR00271 family)